MIGLGSLRFPEKLALHGLDDRDHGGMQQPTFGRDGVESLSHRVDAPDRPDSVLPTQAVGNHPSRREEIDRPDSPGPALQQQRRETNQVKDHHG